MFYTQSTIAVCLRGFIVFTLFITLSTDTDHAMGKIINSPRCLNHGVFVSVVVFNAEKDKDSVSMIWPNNLDS